MEKKKVEELRAILKRSPQVWGSLTSLEREVAAKITGLDTPPGGCAQASRP